jgi:hypothetical protein
LTIVVLGLSDGSYSGRIFAVVRMAEKESVGAGDGGEARTAGSMALTILTHNHNATFLTLVLTIEKTRGPQYCRARWMCWDMATYTPRPK